MSRIQSDRNSYMCYVETKKLRKLSFCSHDKSSVSDCTCGENLESTFDWRWDKENSSAFISPCGTSVKFHPVFSSGTSVAIGDEPLVSGFQYYWEVKLTSPAYGTDVMIGLATSDANLNSNRNHFSSIIGRDNESWGFSYQGYTQHSGVRHKYVCRGRPNSPLQESIWSLGSLVGLHLDTFRGTVEFYVNRKPCGIAYQGLKNKTLFPVVSSTAAKSGLKLTCAASLPTSLQFYSIKQYSQKYSPTGSTLLLCLPPGLAKSTLHKYWFFFHLSQNTWDDKFLKDDSFDISSAADTSGSYSASSGGKSSSSHRKSSSSPDTRTSSKTKRKVEENDSSDEEYAFGDNKKLRSYKKELSRRQVLQEKDDPEKQRQDGIDDTDVSYALDESGPCCSQDVHLRASENKKIPQNTSETISPEKLKREFKLCRVSETTAGPKQLSDEQAVEGEKSKTRDSESKSSRKVTYYTPEELEKMPETRNARRDRERRETMYMAKLKEKERIRQRKLKRLRKKSSKKSDNEPRNTAEASGTSLTNEFAASASPKQRKKFVLTKNVFPK
ncbi:uncharacterized protein LOC111698622 [Eurytemora carolleeae]|uniref:uncharacterized protein LOC111698622 n=1 Tax=Eurytemora carolleeae TaxID=1294199 RepID=UPI000C769D5B|nr:uncharacterized protein LOC111698622 [Eurytemora carolleeae]|eukprot:XP_023324764.1 uncharacterized protein LOC111698622 [Eurytemora affinis]